MEFLLILLLQTLLGKDYYVSKKALNQQLASNQNPCWLSSAQPQESGCASNLHGVPRRWIHVETIFGFSSLGGHYV